MDYSYSQCELKSGFVSYFWFNPLFSLHSSPSNSSKLRFFFFSRMRFEANGRARCLQQLCLLPALTYMNL